MKPDSDNRRISRRALAIAAGLLATTIGVVCAQTAQGHAAIELAAMNTADAAGPGSTAVDQSAVGDKPRQTLIENKGAMMGGDVDHMAQIMPGGMTKAAYQKAEPAVTESQSSLWSAVQAALRDTATGI
jgi:hypothetical protein